MNTKLEEQAIEAAKKDKFDRKERLLNDALSQLKESLPELQRQGDYLELSGHKFQPDYYISISGTRQYYLRPSYGFGLIYDMVSFGEYLIQYNEELKHQENNQSIWSKLFK